MEKLKIRNTDDIGRNMVVIITKHELELSIVKRKISPQNWKKIARLTIVAKGRNFLTRIWKLVSGRKSYFASLNWS